MLAQPPPRENSREVDKILEPKIALGLSLFFQWYECPQSCICSAADRYKSIAIRTEPSSWCPWSAQISAMRKSHFQNRLLTRIVTVQSMREIRALQAGYAGSIPVTRSDWAGCQKVDRRL
jgi:hypothetical protein